MELTSLWDEGHTELATPEQVDLRLEMANVGSRGLAIMVDFAVRYGTMLLLYMLLVVTTNIQQRAQQLDLSGQAFLVYFVLFVFVPEWFYFAIFEWWWNGQTPGKRLLNLRVINSDGSPVGAVEVILRNFLRPVDTIGPMALVGVISIFVTRRNQRPGDLVARTLVIREAPIDWSIFAAHDQPVTREGRPAAPIRLGPHELEALHRYLRRERDLTPGARAATAAAVRRALSASTAGTDLQGDQGDDGDWLREVARRV